MTRRRVNLMLVPSESARKVTFKKRKQGLVKKMEEITTLCGINGCIVIFNAQEDEPLIWPSREKAMELMAKYESMPKMDQDTKKVDHEKFMEHRVDKLREHIAKREKKNKEARASLILYQMTQGKTMEDLNIAEVELLRWFSEVKLREIDRQNLLLPPIGLPTRVSSPLPAPPQMPPPAPPAFCQPSFVVEPPPPPASLFPPPFVVEPPPPPPAFCPPPFAVEPTPPMVDQGMFVGGNAQNGENLMMEPSSCHVENDTFYMNMFAHGSGGLGANGMWQGESSTGNQHNNLDFEYGLDPEFPSSFPGFL